MTIVRFLGTTVNSREITQTLSTICQQLSFALDQGSSHIPKTFKEAQNTFFKMLETFPSDKNLVILLDAVHNVNDDNNGKSLQWIPKQLKENVKLVISTLPETNGILRELQALVEGEQHFVEVHPLVPAECFGVLQGMLESRGKRLSSEQQRVVQRAFQTCGLPLYIRLLYRDAKEWKSYSDINPNSIPRSVKEYINSMFDKLEHSFGKVLVSHSMAYLTASVTGLSDLEMEDILSLDNEVLDEIYGNKRVPVYRVPTVSWLALKNSISDFLMRRECEGVTAYSWNHSQFVEITKDRYLQDKAKQVYIHSILADYFHGTWHGQEKPYDRPVSPGDNRTTDRSVGTDRLVPSQPHTFTTAAQDDKNVTRFNKRMYEQVPRHLFLAGRLGELSDKVMFCYDWLYNKTKCLSLDYVLADFVFSPGVETGLVEKVLRDAKAFIAQDTDCMGVEISGRLLAYYNTHPGIRRLIQGCDSTGVKRCGLLPNFSYQMIPGSPLKYTFTCGSVPTHMALRGTDSRFLLTKEKASQVIQTFDMVTGEKNRDICTSIGEMHVTPDGQKLLIVDHITEKAIKLHCSTTGQYLGQLIPMNQIQMVAKEKYKMGKLCISDRYACFPVSTEISYLCIADLATCRFVEVKGLDGKCEVCQMTPDNRLIFYNVNDKLFSYDISFLEIASQNKIEHAPSQLLFTDKVKKGFMINSKENKLYVMHLGDGNVEMMYKVLLNDNFVDDHIVKMQLSQNEELLLVQGLSNLVVFHLESEVVKCHFTRPENVPQDFKLPKTPTMELYYTSASFTHDSKFVISTIFRQIHVWNVASNSLLTCLHAPVGIIRDMLVTIERAQIVTNQINSNVIQVWGLGDAIGHVSSLDRQTSSIEKILLANNDKTAFIKCKASDEIGVLNMETGHLLDLYTHESHVDNFTVTPEGNYLFVACTPKLSNAANKIWHTETRRIIYEFGNLSAHCIALKNENALVSVCQEDKKFNAPYKVSLFHFKNGQYEEFHLQQTIKFVLSEPFVTPEDKYLVILTADSYNDKKALHINPTICAIAMKSTMTMNCFSAADLHHIVRLRRILHIRPYNNSYTVIALYTNETDPTDGERRLKGYEHCYGFMIFDICSGVVCQVIDSLITPRTPLSDIIFTKDVSLCIDNQSNVFDMANGFYVKNIQPEKPHVPPRCLALRDTVVLYCDVDHLYAVRVADGMSLGDVNVHGKITCVTVCHDERTVVVGCEDGSLISYVLIDALLEDHAKITASIPSRQGQRVQPPGGRSDMSWDKVEDGSLPPYSRPPSAFTIGPMDREMLRSVEHVQRFRPTSDTLLYLNERSKSCAIM